MAPVPVCKTSALLLDAWLGREAVVYYPEEDLRQLIELHIESSTTQIARMEGLGALNFPAIDDVAIAREGERLDEKSILQGTRQTMIPAALSSTLLATEPMV